MENNNLKTEQFESNVLLQNDLAQPIKNKYDILFLFDVKNGNPNGDPDSGNQPRIESSTDTGIVSDVCLKRKIKNFVSTFYDSNKNDIFVKSGNVLGSLISNNEKEAKTLNVTPIDLICSKYYDVRTFGQVLSVGDSSMKGSAEGQLTGPVQVTIAESYHPVEYSELTITRCAVTKPEDAKKERTMGNKFMIPYALYSANIFVSCALAERTKFSEKDFQVLIEALENMFENDRSAARGTMTVRGIYIFKHVGTQHENNQVQNLKEARMGCAPSHKLLEGIDVSLKEGIDSPKSFTDYNINCKWDNKNLPKGVQLIKKGI